LLLGLALKPMLAWAMLRSEVAAVEVALSQSLDAGRQRLAMLVSRDTSNLNESEVRESAIESLAENLNDSVVAPIFWFVLFGLPGAAVYRFANTADAMWGYRGLRHGVNWEWAGKWAARADDLLSWLPARITALLIFFLALFSGAHRLRLQALQKLSEEARKTPSPNSGWPMAAMAVVLDIRLQKPGVYVLNPSGRSPEPEDAVLAQKKASNVVVAACLCAQAAIILIAILKP
jgi:adenosylcobinamide-phosphate synthase